MTQNPIHKVLSVLHTHRVRYLLMGGQACILYGGSELSRDIDIAVLADKDNVSALKSALDELQARIIAVPPFAQEYLDRGHAIHFRCNDSIAQGLRIDIMSRLRNADSFESLWHRRTTAEIPPDIQIDVLSLPDLVKVKKTQRDKDWYHIRRLIEADYAQFCDSPDESKVTFWLREARTVGILKDVSARFPRQTAAVASVRPLLANIAKTADTEIEVLMKAEEEIERTRDKEYWAPLRRELEQLRHGKQKNH